MDLEGAGFFIWRHLEFDQQRSPARYEEQPVGPRPVSPDVELERRDPVLREGAPGGALLDGGLEAVYAAVHPIEARFPASHSLTLMPIPS